MVNNKANLGYSASTQTYYQNKNYVQRNEQSPTKHKLTGYSDNFMFGAPFGGSGIDKGSRRKK